MPTDVWFSVEQRRVAKEKNAADFWAFVPLLPLIAGLFSIVLTFESSAFECAQVASGEQ